MDDKRATDTSQQAEIEKLINLAKDPEIRLQLMVMNRMSLTLAANTEMTHALSVRFEKSSKDFSDHTTMVAAYINQGKGAWRVGMWVVGVLNAVILGLITYQINTMEHFNNRLDVVEKEQTRRAAYVKVLETYIAIGEFKK